ncbi:Uncharacterised protein [Bordetella pertussis]|nr:Uncharacterised protein [Bordetella pertussis]
MSSSLRAVCLGSPPGILRLTKCTTCSRSGARPTVAGGCAACLRETLASRSCAARCTL